MKLKEKLKPYEVKGHTTDKELEKIFKEIELNSFIVKTLAEKVLPKHKKKNQYEMFEVFNIVAYAITDYIKM